MSLRTVNEERNLAGIFISNVIKITLFLTINWHVLPEILKHRFAQFFLCPEMALGFSAVGQFAVRKNVGFG